MPTEGKCHVCGGDASIEEHVSHQKISCIRCGRFTLTSRAKKLMSGLDPKDQVKLSGWIRENQDATVSEETLTLIPKLKIPRLEEKVDKILLHLARKFPKHGDTIELFKDVSMELQGVGWVEDQKELRFIFREYLHDELGFLRCSEVPTLLSTDEFYKISPSGWTHIDSLNRGEQADENATQPMTKYVDPTRILELKAIGKAKFDLLKLIQFCEELNHSLDSKSYLSMIMLTRAIIDHVPPIFGGSSFPQVANNYNGGQSFRASMQHLENSSRKIADQHLHSQVRTSETIPNLTQVNFANDLDVLLAEIVRVLK